MSLHVMPLLFVTPYCRALQALIRVGLLGPAGTTMLEYAEPGPMPLALTAATLNLTGEPFGRPLKEVVVAGGAPLTVVLPCNVQPSLAVTTYEVIALPP